jgi:hypothetical protein
VAPQAPGALGANWLPAAATIVGTAHIKKPSPVAVAILPLQSGAPATAATRPLGGWPLVCSSS